MKPPVFAGGFFMLSAPKANRASNTETQITITKKEMSQKARHFTQRPQKNPKFTKN